MPAVGEAGSARRGLPWGGAHREELVLLLDPAWIGGPRAVALLRQGGGDGAGVMDGAGAMDGAEKAGSGTRGSPGTHSRRR